MDFVFFQITCAVKDLFFLFCFSYRPLFIITLLTHIKLMNYSKTKCCCLPLFLHLVMKMMLSIIQKHFALSSANVHHGVLDHFFTKY